MSSSSCSAVIEAFESSQDSAQIFARIWLVASHESGILRTKRNGLGGG